MFNQSYTNWILFFVALTVSVSGIYYFINLTMEESDRLVASVLALPPPQSRMNTNTQINTDSPTTGAIIRTNYGEIEVSFQNTAPNTVANFAKLAQAEFYNGTKFHRVIKGFMIQGGDPLSKDDSLKDRWGTGGPGYQFADELSGQEKYPQGTLAMANAGPNTNGSQFFIVTASPEAPLPPSYTVFGRVVKGMDVALKIEKVQTGPNDRPVKDVILEKVELK